MTSRIAPFAVNIGVVVFQCESDPEHGGLSQLCSSVPNDLFPDTKVLLLHNERVVDPQPACGDRLCSLESFRLFYEDIANTNFEEECRI